MTEWRDGIRKKNRFDHRSQHEGTMQACGHHGHTTPLLGASSRASLVEHMLAARA
jgi:metal-dependent amidase/aminoacylase/carboxypeptidase family protein